MKIKKGKGQTEFGKGIDIKLSGTEVARAISAFLVTKGVYVDGPATITVNGELCKEGSIYVDPSGNVIDKKGTRISGRTGKPEKYEK